MNTLQGFKHDYMITEVNPVKEWPDVSRKLAMPTYS